MPHAVLADSTVPHSVSANPHHLFRDRETGCSNPSGHAEKTPWKQCNWYSVTVTLPSQNLMLPHKQRGIEHYKNQVLKMDLSFPFFKATDCSPLITARDWKKVVRLLLTQSMAAYCSLARGGRHNKSEMEEGGRRMQWVEEESSETAELMLTSTLKKPFSVGGRHRKIEGNCYG